MSKTYDNVPELIDTGLGGTSKAAEFFNCSAQRVSNWKTNKRIPAALYVEHRRLLAEAGIIADESIWFGKQSEVAAE